METPRYFSFTISRCEARLLTLFEKACGDLQEIQAKHRRVASETEWNWWATCLLVLLSAILVLIFGGLLALAGAILAAALALFALFWRGSAAWFNLRQSFVAAAWGIAWMVQRYEVGICAMRWGEHLQEQGTDPVVTHMVRQMLGDDPDSLFIPGNYEGLRAPRATNYAVETEATRQLKRKLALMEYGTIAVCGPRGSGKTTLLERCVENADFGLLAQAPATYVPHDFLLSLSVRLCETYIRDEGYEVPEFTRLSPFHRLLRRARSGAKRLGRWAAFALPAAALIALGLSASIRSLYEEYASSAASSVDSQGELIGDHFSDIWQGHAVAASVTAVIAGIVWWGSRHNPWLPRLLGRLWTFSSRPLGLLLALVSMGSVFLDEQIRQQVQHVQAGTIFIATGLILVWSFFLSVRNSYGGFRLVRWYITLESVFTPIAAATGVTLLAFLIRNSQTYPLLSDTENPVRLAGIMAGVLLARAGDWRPQPAEPELVTRCRNHLYRLQTIQMSTSTLSASAPQAMGIGGTHSASISTIPPNLPELVEDFRNLLERIADRKAMRGETVAIAIDEVDRLGTATQALAFLGEIKAVLGVAHVYYLISVAEDVGAAFVRRGLPHRDVTDSSLDDIIHVRPSTLRESSSILAKRSELTDPYVVLSHALSGGILRDLLRYALQIKEMQDKIDSFELTDISRHLILEELSETLAGFRTLLSQQQWNRSTSGILSSFGILCGYLHDPCLCKEVDLQNSLNELAFSVTHENPDVIAFGELTDEARQLIDEASAYAYFSLTLLDIFSVEGFERRKQLAAGHGSDGDPERLAEVRQELGISPYSARPLIDNIRKAWSLPLRPMVNGRVRPSRPGNCPVHSLRH